jgi:hypothetical protein
VSISSMAVLLTRCDTRVVYFTRIKRHRILGWLGKVVYDHVLCGYDGNLGLRGLNGALRLIEVVGE